MVREIVGQALLVILGVAIALLWSAWITAVLIDRWLTISDWWITRRQEKGNARLY